MTVSGVFYKKQNQICMCITGHYSAFYSTCKPDSVQM